MTDHDEDRKQAVTDARRALSKLLASERRWRGRDTQRRGTLSYSRWAVLRVLADRNEHSVGNVALAASVSPASATKLLDGLEHDGLVERVRASDDRRRISVMITEAGYVAWLDKDDETQAAWEHVLADVEITEIQAIARALRYVVAVADHLDV
jgi:DNA-binding MarR family transcriptional regulator